MTLEPLGQGFNNDLDDNDEPPNGKYQGRSQHAKRCILSKEEESNFCVIAVQFLDRLELRKIVCLFTTGKCLECSVSLVSCITYVHASMNNHTPEAIVLLSVTPRSLVSCEWNDRLFVREATVPWANPYQLALEILYDGPSRIRHIIKLRVAFRRDKSTM